MKVAEEKSSNESPVIIEDLLTINPFSRSGKFLDKIMALVIHNIGVGGQSAKEARNYWENLKTQEDRDAKPDISASAHFIIDLDGKIIRTIPETEKAYHCGATTYTLEAQDFFGNYCTDRTMSPNRVSIGIELTHPDSSGKPTRETFESALLLVRFLCEKYGLNPRKDVWRHWDITRKNCPRWFVSHESAWTLFLESI